MRAPAFCAALCLLLACSVQGRRLLVDEGCADLSVLKGVANTTEIQKLIAGIKLLPNGVPADRTIFLPNNDAVAALLAEVPIPGITLDTLLPMLPSLGDMITNRLVSALLYHIVPGSQTAEQLLAEGTLATELSNFAQGAAAGSYTVTDATGAVANVVGEPVTACGSTVFVIDQVLKPAELLSPDFPLTSLDEACSDLSVLSEELPQASDILAVIQELGVFRGGITPGTTWLLPNNEAAALLPQDLQLPFKLDTLASAMPALGPEVKWRIVSTIMYHVSTVGALNGTQLAQRGDLPTVLEGASLLGCSWRSSSSTVSAYLSTQATDNQPVSAWAVTDGSGRKALPVAGPSPTALAQCGAAVYVIDTAMLPAPELWAVPKTTVAQAVDALAVVRVEALAAAAEAQALEAAAAAAAAPAPAPAPAGDAAAPAGEAAPAPLAA
ncbi:hypothetical protein COHA_005652 [Chlorella ohadii]|uniref:FAS1 domain-containing protein n=1 Tax=Chlorella ohadii TaxID=2649997 RepID=A0AAD5DRE4_9CHLO|nr:hypothetical protein COHA_005652 [Chlorella ohadii]